MQLVRCFQEGGVHGYSSARAPPRVLVKFRLQQQTRFGESIGLVSSASGWDTRQPLRLEWSEGSIWRGEAELPAGEDLEYKYVLLSDRDGSVACWQPGGNQVLHLGSQEQALLVLDDWQGATHEVQPAPSPAPVAADGEGEGSLAGQHDSAAGTAGPAATALAGHLAPEVATTAAESCADVLAVASQPHVLPAGHEAPASARPAAEAQPTEAHLADSVRQPSAEASWAQLPSVANQPHVPLKPLAAEEAASEPLEPLAAEAAAEPLEPLAAEAAAEPLGPLSAEEAAAEPLEPLAAEAATAEPLAAELLAAPPATASEAPAATAGSSRVPAAPYGSGPGVHAHPAPPAEPAAAYAKPSAVPALQPAPGSRVVPPAATGLVRMLQSLPPILRMAVAAAVVVAALVVFFRSPWAAARWAFLACS